MPAMQKPKKQSAHDPLTTDSHQNVHLKNASMSANCHPNAHLTTDHHPNAHLTADHRSKQLNAPPPLHPVGQEPCPPTESPGRGQGGCSPTPGPTGGREVPKPACSWSPQTVTSPSWCPTAEHEQLPRAPHKGARHRPEEQGDASDLEKTHGRERNLHRHPMLPSEGKGTVSTTEDQETLEKELLGKKTTNSWN